MRNIKRAGVLMAAALSALVLIGASPSGAQDLDCGDPGTFHNMPVDPNNDPNGLDADHNGIGCEDESVFGDDAEPAPTPAPPSTEAPAPEQPAPAPAAPAEPVVEAPTFTG